MHWVISEDGRFISSKSGVDPGRNHGATDVPKKVRTDRQTAFCLYIVDLHTVVMHDGFMEPRHTNFLISHIAKDFKTQIASTYLADSNKNHSIAEDSKVKFQPSFHPYYIARNLNSQAKALAIFNYAINFQQADEKRN